MIARRLQVPVGRPCIELLASVKPHEVRKPLQHLSPIALRLCVQPRLLHDPATTYMPFATQSTLLRPHRVVHRQQPEWPKRRERARDP